MGWPLSDETTSLMTARGRRCWAFAVALAGAIALTGCGASDHHREEQGAAPVAAVRHFLAALSEMGHVSHTYPLPAAVTRTCGGKPLERRYDCLIQVLKLLPARGNPPQGTAAARAALTATAQRQLARIAEAEDGELATVEALTGGTGYPPTCADLFRILGISGIGGSVSVVARMAGGNTLAEHTFPWTRIPLALVDLSGKRARVRVADGKSPVTLLKVGDNWRIASFG